MVTQNDTYPNGAAVLRAYDATNLANFQRLPDHNIGGRCGVEQVLVQGCAALRPASAGCWAVQQLSAP